MDEHHAMIGTQPATTRQQTSKMDLSRSVVVACPDARPPAYELVAGLSEKNRLCQFLTGYYHKPFLVNSMLPKMGRRGRSLLNQLERRQIAGLDSGQVQSFGDYDASIRLENWLANRRPGLRARLARNRTERFDRQMARSIPRLKAQGARSALFFSDVGSVHAMAEARRNGLKVVLSMVTGHVDEEMEILERERLREPSFFPVYLGDGRLDLDELQWLHHRRRLDLAQADLVLVPSEHIAKLVRERSHVPANRVRVIPYAADPDRFRPRPSKSPNSDNGVCRFLFAGGITQRKGLSDLLKAWAIVRRPEWSLSLVGAAPKAAESLVPKDDPSINLLGKVAYGDMPEVMAEHDLFLFPSLFEGSAVVCYEALASGLPVITTPQAGSVVRDGLEGRICEAADHKSLSAAMMDLGTDPELRARMSESARLRALDHTWDHYRERVMQALEDVADMSFREIGPLPRQGPK